eukprot:GHVU01224421.1.p3 GENE.GHVU01224421.1~~GHVU01224421.1.p3  ORF type:complete len:101 (-),score=4.22 GHVU01224421.1:62-364(-)
MTVLIMANHHHDDEPTNDHAHDQRPCMKLRTNKRPRIHAHIHTRIHAYTYPHIHTTHARTLMMLMLASVSVCDFALFFRTALFAQTFVTNTGKPVRALRP